jgi:putative acetyltransferase
MAWGRCRCCRQHQRQGIGKALIRQGLARLQAMGMPGAVAWSGIRITTGSSVSGTSTSLAHAGVPPEYFLALSFDGHWPQGAVAFHEAFGARE